MTNKMTKRDYFNTLLTIEAVSHNPELVAFINHELELLAKKSKSTTSTKKTDANNSIKEAIIATLADKKAHTVTEIVIALDNEYTNQKISALLKQLVEDGKVEKISEKKKSYFFLPKE